MIMRVWYQTWCIQAIKQNANERSRRRRNNKKTVTKKLLELFDFAISHFTCICDYCSTHSQVFVGYINIKVAVRCLLLLSVGYICVGMKMFAHHSYYIGAAYVSWAFVFASFRAQNQIVDVFLNWPAAVHTQLRIMKKTNWINNEGSKIKTMQ